MAEISMPEATDDVIAAVDVMAQRLGPPTEVSIDDLAAFAEKFNVYGCHGRGAHEPLRDSEVGCCRGTLHMWLGW